MRKLGYSAEKQAQRWLEQQGCRLVAHNFYCRYGEIDLIMQQDSILLFIEVRFRMHRTFWRAT